MTFQLNIEQGLRMADPRPVVADMLREVAYRLDAGSMSGYVLSEAGDRVGMYGLVAPHRSKNCDKECRESLEGRRII